MNHTALVKFAPVASVERTNTDWQRPGRTSYWGGSLKLMPGHVPLIVDHDPDIELGTVDKLFTLQWPDGPWIAARCTLNKPPDTWMRPFHTKASFGFINLAENNDRVASGLVKEVSLLVARQPVEPGAELIGYHSEPTSLPARRNPPTTAAAQSTIVTGPMLEHAKQSNAPASALDALYQLWLQQQRAAA